MRRPLSGHLALALCLAACSGPPAAPPSPPTVVVAPPPAPAVPTPPAPPVPAPSPSLPLAAPTVYAPAPPGLPLARLQHATPLTERESDAFYAPGGVLRIDASDPTGAACTPDGSFVTDDLGDAPPLVDAECNEDGTRCVKDARVHFLRRGAAGLWLRAVVVYASADDVPPVEAPRVQTILSRRDRVCELYELLHGHAPRVDPHGYASEHEDDAGHLTWTLSCGAEALASARRDFAAHDGLTCSQTLCATQGGNDGSWIAAHRDDAGVLLVYAASDAPTGASAAGPDDAWRRIFTRACP